MKTMRVLKELLIIWTAVICSCLHTISAQDPTGLKVTFINNETFLLTLDSIKVLIDAPFASTVIPTSGSTLQKIRMATSPFDNIDLICITHDHDDHYSRNDLGVHLENDSDTKVICPNAVANQMKSYANYDQIKDRILQINPAFNSKDSVEVDGIPVKILGFRHAMPEFYTMDHECFLIDINGIKIFHSGDSWGTYIDELEAFQLQNDSIDIAFLMVEYFWEGAGKAPLEGLEKVLNYLSPKNIVIMHNEPGYLNGGQQIIDAVENDFPNIYLFKNELEEKVLENGVLTGSSELTGLKVTSDKDVHFFPNPTTGQLNILFGTMQVLKANAEVYNLMGNLVLSENCYNTTASVIDLAPFPSGIYAVKVVVNGDMYETRIIKE